MPDDEKDKDGKAVHKTFDAFLASLPEENKKLVEDHIGGLTRALDRVKDERNTLRDEIKSIRESKTLDAEGKLTELQKSLDAAERRAKFFESLPKEVRNPKAAFVLYSNDETLQKKDGSFDADKFKESYPEMFGTDRNAKGFGGNGTDKTPPQKSDMNSLIRTKAGVAPYSRE